MLSKEEREAIVKRLNYCGDTDYYSFYRAVTGHNTTTKITLDEDVANLEKIIFDLCDTGNMVELPLGKDGKIIKVGDTVYNENMDKCRVTGIEYMAINSVCIHCFATSTFGSVTYLPNQLTHTPVSETEQLAKAIKNAVDTFNEQLREFSEYMASVGGNND